jgi:hypothetical protein
VSLDESGFMLTPTVCRTLAPRGETPALKSWDRHDRISAISAITVSPARRRLGLYFRLLPVDHELVLPYPHCPPCPTPSAQGPTCAGSCRAPRSRPWTASSRVGTAARGASIARLIGGERAHPINQRSRVSRTAKPPRGPLVIDQDTICPALPMSHRTTDTPSPFQVSLLHGTTPSR